MEFMPEPYRTKAVERITLLPREQRIERLRQARFNVFKIPAADIFIDLLTDSGTGAMSDNQWAGLMIGDESYAYCRNYITFEDTVRDITGFNHIIPVHQGRVAENLLFTCTVKKGDYVPSNNHFDTTRANVEHQGAMAVDLVVDEGLDPKLDAPFKGNIDLNKVENLIKKVGRDKIPVGMLTVTNNAGGGQPVSLANIKAYSELLHKYGIPFYLDACRYAENCYFIKKREPGQQNRSVKEIAREMFSYADGCTMSAKKDGLANIGGFIATNNDELAIRLKNMLILIEGFITYGGLAGRDLEAIARGLVEALDEDYLAYRTEQVRMFGQMLLDEGIPIVQPPGGHAIFVDVNGLLPKFPRDQYPGWGVTVALYREGGVRAVEIGGVMLGQHPDGSEHFPEMELVRLAVPRRVYSMAHLAYVVSILKKIRDDKSLVKPLKITWQAPALRHFTADFAEI
ncbi:MAG: tryptophanase [candidate division Zixibacteria bacterium]|nr:tryptophanase [candidate division Zixibacteria bacterium]